jgi:hypothetical protein
MLKPLVRKKLAVWDDTKIKGRCRAIQTGSVPWELHPMAAPAQKPTFNDLIRDRVYKYLNQCPSAISGHPGTTRRSRWPSS